MSKEIESKEEFDKTIKTDKKVVVDFFATWCMPCRMMGQVLEEMGPDYPEVTFIKVDVDKHPEIAQQFGVYSIPQLNIFKDGADKGKLVGSRPRSEMDTLLAKAFN